MPSETDALVVPTNGDTEAPPPPRMPRRRKSTISPLVVGILAFIFIAAIVIGIVVVWNAEKRRRQPKQLWLNLQTSSTTNNNTTTTIAPGCETTILLMRHCEKYGPLVMSGKHNQHCSLVGLERAHYMAFQLFNQTWPNPSFLYALSPDRGGHFNHRQVETLTPIALKLGLSINSDFKEGQDVQLATHVFQKMQTGKTCGKVVVISWTHRSLPQLAAAFGCGTFTQEHGGCPYRFPEDSFDQVWMLKYVYEPSSVLETNKKHKKHASHEWAMYSTVTQMGFDPLQFSFQAGDYPHGGKSSGGAWMKEL